MKLALAAAEQQLRRLVFCLLKTRSSWQETEGLVHSLGAAAPDPWLLNTQAKRRAVGGEGRHGAVSANLHNDLCLGPSRREEADRAEADAVHSLALARPRPRTDNPLGLFDLLAALREDKEAIPNHSLYSLSMERIIMKLHHPAQ